MYLIAWSHSFILFIHVTSASVVLQSSVRFTSAFHVLVHCLFVDKDCYVPIAYFQNFAPIASKEISQGFLLLEARG